MKTVRQIDLALKNEPGALSAIGDLLGANGINIVAFYVAAEKEKGILRFVTNDPDRTLKVLKTAGYDLQEKEVIACEVPRHPGGLNSILRCLKTAGIDIDYIYPCIGAGETDILILGAKALSEASDALESNWIRTLDTELYSF